MAAATQEQQAHIDGRELERARIVAYLEARIKALKQSLARAIESKTLQRAADLETEMLMLHGVVGPIKRGV